jgi:acylphosphatase
MIHVIISGDVQGVGFRQFVRYNAKKLNIKGWVKNLPDGNVEGMFTGNRQNLNTMIEFCKKGPFLSRVENIELNELPDREFESFDIIKE